MEVSKISREGKWMEVLNAKAFHGDPNFASSCSYDVLPSPVSLTGIPFLGKGLEKWKNFCALVEIKSHKNTEQMCRTGQKKPNQTKPQQDSLSGPCSWLPVRFS